MKTYIALQSTAHDSVEAELLGNKVKATGTLSYVVTLSIVGILIFFIYAKYIHKHVKHHVTKRINNRKNKKKTRRKK